jgi:hypothetical protein
MDRIAWACKSKGMNLVIQHPSCSIQILIDPIRFIPISGDPIESAKLIRDIEVLALDKDYYPIDEEIPIE